MITPTNTQEAFRINAQGHMVPESLVKEIDKLRDDVVLEIVNGAKAMQAEMLEFKTKNMAKVADFVDISASEYGVKYGGTKGNVTLTSYDGKYKIVRSIGQRRVFDERIQAAKAVIDNCIHCWNEGSDDRIKALVEWAFKVDKQGHIDVANVQSLNSLDIDDPEWLDAMKAINDSVGYVGTKPYLRVYERKEDGSYKQIALDIAKL